MSGELTVAVALHCGSPYGILCLPVHYALCIAFNARGLMGATCKPCTLAGSQRKPRKRCVVPPHADVQRMPLHARHMNKHCHHGFEACDGTRAASPTTASMPTITNSSNNASTFYISAAGVTERDWEVISTLKFCVTALSMWSAGTWSS